MKLIIFALIALACASIETRGEQIEVLARLAHHRNFLTLKVDDGISVHSLGQKLCLKENKDIDFISVRKTNSMFGGEYDSDKKLKEAGIGNLSKVKVHCRRDYSIYDDIDYENDLEKANRYGS